VRPPNFAAVGNTPQLVYPPEGFVTQHTPKYVKSISISQTAAVTDGFLDDVSIQVGGVEKVTNGGFETGDFTGWTTSGNANIQGSGAHSGTYCVLLGLGAANVSQTLNLGGKASSFTLWSKRNTPCPTYGNLRVVITYTDNSTTTINIDLSTDSAWTKHDLTSQVQDG
jgi:hypothetical protein